MNGRLSNFVKSKSKSWSLTNLLKLENIVNVSGASL